MTKYKSKNCVTCGTEYLPTGRCSKYCVECSKLAIKQSIKKWHFTHGILNGAGSGSSTKSGEHNPMYKHGRCTFRTWARERKNSLGHCEECRKT